MPNIIITSDETVDLNYAISNDLTELEHVLNVVQNGSNKDLNDLGIRNISAFTFSPSNSDFNEEYVFDIAGESEDLIVNVYDIPNDTLWQSTTNSDEQKIKNWWSENWTFKTDNATFGADYSFTENRHGALNSIAPFADEDIDWGSNTRSWFETTAFDLTNYDKLTVWGEGRRESQSSLSQMELRIYIDNNLVRQTTQNGWVKFTIDISGYSGNVPIELGVYNNRGAGLTGDYSEFSLE
jgi:hypothetical protein